MVAVGSTGDGGRRRFALCEASRARVRIPTHHHLTHTVCPAQRLEAPESEAAALILHTHPTQPQPRCQKVKRPERSLLVAGPGFDFGSRGVVGTGTEDRFEVRRVGTGRGSLGVECPGHGPGLRGRAGKNQCTLLPSLGYGSASNVCE